MSQNISLEKSLQAYRVLAAPAKMSWKQHYADEEFSSPDRLLCDEYEQKQFAKRLEECPITICDSITAREGASCTLVDLVNLLNSPENKGIAKARRKVLYSTSDGTRPIGKHAFELWNGFQVIDMDIKDADMAQTAIEYAKFSVLTQSGQAMLAQANQNRSGVLSLLS